MLYLKNKNQILKRKLSGIFNLTQAIFVLVIVVSTHSCIKDEIPVLTVSALQEEIEYGATATISWTSDNVTMINVDGVKLSDVKGSFVTEPLTKTTTFIFTATGPGGTVSTSITVIVKDMVVDAYVYAMPSSVVKYNNPVTTVYWETKNVASATVNNKSISVNDSIKFEFLTKDTTLNFTFIGKNGEKVEKSQLIDVGEPTKIDLMVDLICGKWNATKEETEVSPGVWQDTGLPEKYMRNIRTFYKDGTLDVYDPLEKTYSIVRSNAKWYFINENKLFYGGKTDSIISLTENELIFGFYFIVYDHEAKKDVDGPKGRTTFLRIK